MDRCWNHSPGAHYPPGPEPWRRGGAAAGRPRITSTPTTWATPPQDDAPGSVLRENSQPG